MCELWNKIDIVPPPINTAKAVLQNEDVVTLREIANDFDKELNNMDWLHKEAAILSRIIYRMKLKFRSDKGFKAMEKVNRSLLRYLNTDIQCDIKNFSKTININNYSSDGTIYLPSRQMLEYILVRLQGFAKLFCRIVDSCLIASNYMLERINSGQSWPISFLVFSTVSKICSITKNFTKFMCNTYQKLYIFYDKLQPTGLKWLPENYILETNLEKWLDEDWLDENPTLNKSISKSNENKIFDLIDFKDDDVEFVKSYDLDFQNLKTDYFENKKQNPVSVFRTDSVDTLKTDPTKNGKIHIDQSAKNKIIHNTKIDVGKPISRNMFDSTKKTSQSVSQNNYNSEDNCKSVIGDVSAAALKEQNGMEIDTQKNNTSESIEKNNTSNIKNKKHAVRFIKNKKDLKTFMVKETKYRKKNSCKCLSKELDELQWRKLQKLAVKALKKLDSDEIEESAKLKRKILKQAKSEMLVLLKDNE